MKHQTRKPEFPATRWSLVLNARDDNPQALAGLCRDYWFPLYCCARRLRPSRQDAEDLTQAFFVHLLTREFFAQARSERGKLRSFLSRSLTNFARDQYRRSNTEKRGAAFEHVQIDSLGAEQRMALEPREDATPEVAFDRAWARQLLDDVLERLETSYAEVGRLELFSALREYLIPGAEKEPYGTVAERLGMKEGAVRLSVFKLRKRYRNTLKELVGDTVSDSSEIEEELRHLRTVFGN